MAARPSRGASGLRFTWIGMLAYVYVLLTLPPSLRHVSDLERVLFWPATVVVGLVHDWRGWAHPVLFPLLAALQALSMGLLADLPRLWRAGRSRRWPVFSTSDPLAPWKVVLCGLMVVVTAALWTLRETDTPFGMTGKLDQGPKATLRRAQLQTKVESTRRRATEMPLVVVIGDSLTTAAFRGPQSLELALRKRLGRPIQFESWAVNGQELREIEPHVEHLLEQRPDFVMIESNLLFLTTPRAIATGRATRTRRWANRLLDSMEAASLALGWSRQDGTTRFDAEPVGLGTGARRRDPELKHVELRWMGRETSSSDPAFLFARQLTDRLSDQGIHPVIFATPPSDHLQSLSARFHRDVRRMAAGLAADCQGTWLPYRGPAPLEWYLDGAHMNSIGSEQYHQWLVPRLAHIIETQRAGASTH